MKYLVANFQEKKYKMENPDKEIFVKNCLLH